MSYGVLAKHYDALMRHVDYDLWADYIGGLFDCAQTPLETVLDMACGTGTLTYALARRGFTAIGVDASPDMLACASAKRNGVQGEQPLFLCQKLWELDLFGTVDAAVCMLDSLNYIIQPQKLRLALQRAGLFMNPGGVLVFDVRTPEYFEESSGKSFVIDTPGCFCAWTPDYSRSIYASRIDLFERRGDMWGRLRETHRQRAYTVEFLTECLVGAGFVNIETFHPFLRVPPKKNADRVFFRAVRAYN